MGTKGWSESQIHSVKLLGAEEKVTWLMTAWETSHHPSIKSRNFPIRLDFQIQTDTDQHEPNVIIKDSSKALKGTKKVDIDGHD